LTFFETLENLDRKLFLFLNGQHHAQLDKVMFWMSNELFWIPFYLVIISLLVYYFRKQSILLLLFTAATITASDQISVLIKNAVKRYRPCHNLEIGNLVHVVGNCGGQYGFLSSHAANTFALATFMTFLLVKKYEYIGVLLFGWAAIVSFSRIYVGVHYPADVACGALLGMGIGWTMWKLYNLVVQKSGTPVSLV
jgi:undecaprenyl-diphosphatase